MIKSCKTAPYLDSVLKDTPFRRLIAQCPEIRQEVVWVHGIQSVKKHINSNMQVEKVHFRCIT